MTTTGAIQGFNITSNLKEFDITHDKESKEASEKQLEVNRKKIELTNKINMVKLKNQRIE